jgi:DNA-binding GntR family transcriptional regulator
MSVEQIVAMFELMAELEAMAAKLAATRMSPELRRKLNDTYVRSEKYLKDEKKYNAIDAELHEIISLGSHNEYLDEAIKNAHSRTRLYRPAPFHHPGLTTQSFREHGVILDAIANGEGDAAGQAMHAHLTSSGRIFADFIARLARVR